MDENMYNNMNKYNVKLYSQEELRVINGLEQKD